MKIIHCADIHLDSALSQNYTEEQRDRRNMELLHTFERMVEYANKQKVQAILIAGDLFDQAHVSKTVKNSVQELILQHPQILFFYLRGNHDAVQLLEWQEQPKNLMTFTETWSSYRLWGEHGEPVIITGAEIQGEEVDTQSLCEQLQLEEEGFQIVMLHGQIREGRAKKGSEDIPLPALRGKGIDYLALGHIHSYQSDAFDARGTYCYCGCLEGRGFDECGVHGFVLLDINEHFHTYTQQFIPFAYRRLYEISVDISSCMNSLQIAQCVEAALQREGCSQESLVRVILIGKQDVTAEKNLTYLQTGFEESFFYFSIEDQTTSAIRYEDYAGDISWKGEFVRTVLAAEELPKEVRMEVMKTGIRALDGQDFFD